MCARGSPPSPVTLSRPAQVNSIKVHSKKKVLEVTSTAGTMGYIETSKVTYEGEKKPFQPIVLEIRALNQTLQFCHINIDTILLTKLLISNQVY